MYLRDLSVFLLLAVLVVATLRRPYIGALGWVLFGIMNPHRLTFGPAFNFAFSQVIALTTLVAMLASREHKEFKGGAPAVVLLVLLVWVSLNTALAFNPPKSLDYLDRVGKTFLFVWITLLLMHTRQHVHWLLATLVFSLGFYGVKGGLFVIATGGDSRVWGPSGSMVEGNNELAVGLIMIIPLLFYFVQQARLRWQRWALLAAMLLCALAALGSYSRGALLAITGMSLFLWVRSSRKGVIGAGILALLFLAIPFMPAKWTERMNTINAYEDDNSASFRLVAWETAYNLAKDRFPLGGGFEYESRDVSSRYSPLPDLVMVPHSVYFQTLGSQGFIGLGLLALFWILVWRQCAWLRTHCRSPDLAWAHQLASMVQVSLVGFAIGGTFLNLAFWDGPFYVYCVIALTLYIVRRELASKSLTAGRPSAHPQHAAAGAPPGTVSLHP